MHHHTHLHHLHSIQMVPGHAHYQIPNNFGFLKKLGKVCKWSPLVMSILTIVMGIVSLLIIGANFYGKYGLTTPFTDVSGNASMVPHSSRMFHVKGLFCQSITVSRFFWDNSEADLAWIASVSVTFKEPPSEFNNFSITKELHLVKSNYYYAREFYLHPKSEIRINSCLQQSDPNVVYVCIIKGTRGFNTWLQNHNQCTGPLMHKHGINFCRNESTILQTSKYAVSKKETYFIVHYATSNFSKTPHVSMNVSIFSYDYYVADSNFTCSATSYNSCTTNGVIPLTSRGYAVVTVTADENDTDWSYEDKIKLSWKCNPSPRGFMLVIFLSAISVFACIFSCCCFCGCLSKRCKNRRCTQNSLSSLSQQTNTSQHSSSRELFVHNTTHPMDETQRLLPEDSSDNSVKAQKHKKCSICEACYNMFIIVMLALIFTIIEGILPILLITLTPSDLVFIPGGTYSFPVDNFFCSSLSVDIAGSTRLSASVWLTDQTPTLKNFTTFSNVDFNCKEIDGCYKAWRAHLRSGSEVNVQALNYGNSQALLTNFSSEDDFQVFLTQFTRKHSNKSFFSKSFYRYAYAVSANNNTSLLLLPYSKEEDYIFVLYSLGTASVNVSLEFLGFEYDTNISSSSHRLDLHSYTTSSGTLSVPSGTGYTNALIQVTSEEKYSDLEYLVVDTYCNLQASTWTLVWLPVLVINLIFFYHCLVFMEALFYNWRVKKIKESQNVNRSSGDYGTTTAQISDSRSSPSGSMVLARTPEGENIATACMVPKTTDNSEAADNTPPILTSEAAVVAINPPSSAVHTLGSGSSSCSRKGVATSPLSLPENEGTACAPLPRTLALVEADVHQVDELNGPK